MAISNNRLSAEITDTQKTDVIAAIDTIKSILTFLIGLTKEERQKLPKIDVSNKEFTDDAIRLGKENTNLLPAYLDITEIEKDFVLYEDLQSLVDELASLTEMVRDTQILAGSEAFQNALMLYRMFQNAARAGVEGTDSIVDQLKSRFEGQGPSADGEGEDPDSGEPTDNQ